jgi:O-acetyl-ADP-ribose deacetylase (regulator of RNase III)
MRSEILYIKGDATRPSAAGNKIIVHVCNDVGGWGKGFVVAVSKRWKQPEAEYRQWFKTKANFGLGEAQFVKVEEDVWVANLIGQHKMGSDENENPPVRYEAIATGLEKVGEFAQEIDASVHMPRIGCGLAGGTWDRIEPIIMETLIEKNISTTVYDFQ